MTDYFDVFEYIDNWIYFGYFLNLKSHLNAFRDTYYGARLPWIVPGFLVHQIFPPLIAALVLHLGYYLTSLVSVYLILKRTINSRVGLFCAILLGSYGFFIVTYSTDYVDGAAITYFCLTLLMLVPKRGSHFDGLRFSFAGLFFGCMIFTQMFLVTYLPLFLICYYYLHLKKKGITGFWSDVFFFLVGFLGCALLFCLINYYLCGQFWFFVPNFKISQFLLKENVWWAPLNQWINKAYWLIVPFVIFVGAFLGVFRKNNVKGGISNGFLIGYLVVMIIQMVIDFVIKQPMLSLYYYVCYMIAPMFLAMGTLISNVISQLSRKAFYLYILLFCLAVLSMCYFSKNAEWVNGLNLKIAILGAVAGFILIGLSSHKIKLVGMGLVALLIPYLNGIVHKLGVYKPKGGSVPWEWTSRKNGVLSLVEAFKVVQKLDPAARARFWYNCTADSGRIFHTLCSCYLWQYSMVSENFPGLSNYHNYQPALQDRIFVMTPREENAIEQINTALASNGLTSKLLEEAFVNVGEFDFKITYIEVEKLL